MKLLAIFRFLKVMAMVWAGSQVTKLIRAGGWAASIQIFFNYLVICVDIMMFLDSWISNSAVMIMERNDIVLN